MTTSKVSVTDAAPAPARRVSLRVAVCTAVAVAAAIAVLATAQRGVVSSSTRNPAGQHLPPPVRPLFPSVDWLAIGQILGAALFVGTIAAVIWRWRSHPREPLLLMVLASNTLCWFDPINNWAIGLVYNPKLWHFPQDWPWVRMSPIIEPLTSFVYAPYVLFPYFIAMPLMRRLQRRRGPDAFVWRHPLICVALLTFCAGFAWDAGQEVFLVRTEFLTYTHVVRFGSIDVGKYSQLPVLMASGLITIVMIPAAVLLYRDDTGRTQAERIAGRLKLHARRPATATFLVMTLILNASFVCFSTSFWLVRVTGAASSVACPWPYPASKVWDPRGRYEAQGQAGPFTAGAASTWLSGQPDGRPQHVRQTSTRCSAAAH